MSRYVTSRGKKKGFWSKPDFWSCFSCQNSATLMDGFPRLSGLVIVSQLEGKHRERRGVCAHTLRVIPYLQLMSNKFRTFHFIKVLHGEKMSLVNSTSILLAPRYSASRVISVSAVFILKTFCNGYHEGRTSCTYIPHCCLKRQFMIVFH